MQVIHSIDEMRRACRSFLSGSSTVSLGLVPTMGALHEGHLSLVRAARSACDRVAVSIFVNPMQFGPAEDFAEYPRTLDRDRELLEHEGVDLLFAPTAEEMYPAGAQAWVDVPAVGDHLDGASRPGHFRGVATVVAKLFHTVQPDKAFFGQKDAAQVAVLKTMVGSLNFGVELVVCPTVRDPDGLALSSRNIFLSTTERQTALALVRSLRRVEQAVAEGECSGPILKGIMLSELPSAEGFQLDYAEIVDPLTLQPLSCVGSGALVAIAAWIGNTRLIDNVLIGSTREKAK